MAAGLSGLVDGYRPGVGAWCRFLSCMDLQGLEAVVVCHGSSWVCPKAETVWGGTSSEREKDPPRCRCRSFGVFVCRCYA